MADECKDIKPQFCGGRLIPYIKNYDSHPSNEVCVAKVCEAIVGCDE